MDSQTERLNPYAKFLQQQNPLDVITATPQRLEQLTSKVPAEKLQRTPAPKKWSVRDILCHLADCELVFAYRLRQTLAESHHVIQPFDQDAFAATYPDRDARDALATFAAIRRWNVLYLRSATPAALSKPVTHPERGSMTFQNIVETMGGHDLNHLSQITALLA